MTHNQSGKLAGVNYDFDTVWVSDTNANIAFNPGSSDEIDYQTASLALTRQVYSIDNTLTFDYLQPVVDSSEEFEFLTSIWTASKDNTSLAVQSTYRNEYQHGDRPTGSIATLSDYDYLAQPKAILDHKNSQWPLGFVSSEQLQYGHFTRALPDEFSDALSTSNAYRATNADRYHAQLSLSRPLKGDNWSITPVWTGQATRYQLQNNFTDFDYTEFYEGQDITQLAWRAHIDAKATLTAAQTKTNKYLVKPRLYYGYAPLFKDQQTPTLEGDFADTFVLFTDRRFSGIDQVGDMSRLSASLGWEWLHNDTSYLTVSVAKGVKLAEERLVETAYGSKVTDATADWKPEYSDWKGSTKIRLSENLSFTGSVSYSDDWKTANEYSAVLAYKPGDGRVFTLSAEKDDTEDTDANGDDIDGYSREIYAGAYLPIYRNIALMSYVSFYAFTPDDDVGTENDFSREDLALEQLLFGIDYDTCCWNIRLATLTVNSAAFDETDSLFPVETKQTYYFEFTLKGLGGGAGSIENILKRLDFGYSGKIFNYQ